MSRFGKVSDGINKTNAFNRDGLTCGSFQHYQSDQVVDQYVHRQFLLDTFHGMAMQGIHVYRLFEMAEGWSRFAG
jgi:hypothetical protein